MKRKLLIRCIMAVAALLTTSCTNDLVLEGREGPSSGEEVEVTFSISAETAQAATRADDGQVHGPGQWQTNIGKGKEIDMLIYAVYEEVKDADGNVTDYSLLEQYGQGYMTYNKTTGATPETDFPTGLGSLAAHKGQTIYNVRDIFKEVGGTVQITLRLMRERTYHVAFWAQSSETDAYDTSDLKEVKVNYGDDNNLKDNNDEKRDAFCKVEILSISTESATRKVILTRPFAQINVGTTGADYKKVSNSTTPGRTATQSKIELRGVAQYFSVVEDKVIIDNNTHPLTNVTFDFNKIPAYIKTDIPTSIPENTYTEVTDGIVADNNLQQDEEFLKINLNQDNDDLKGYKITYPTIKKGDDKITFLTETFKYLSMCYVLVPSHKIEKPNYSEDLQDSETTTTDDPYTSSTLNGVKVWFAETDKDGNATRQWQPIGGSEDNDVLANVPVHRNWRTNILFGLYEKTPGGDSDDPDDPDESDDPTSIWKATSLSVTIDSYFNGEYNTTDEGGTWNQDTYGDNPPATGKE